LIRAVYALLKGVHVGAVVLSGAGFVLRYALPPPEPAPRSAWVRVAPHVVDVVLLASALALAWQLHANPLELPWLGAKLVGLVFYIVCGSIALKGRTARGRAFAFVAAVACYAYIVSVALTKNPWGLVLLLP